MHQNSTWTEAQIEQLKTLWSDGSSATDIAKLMGLASRSAVLGKIHRLKLPKRREAWKPVAPPRSAVELEAHSERERERMRERRARKRMRLLASPRLVPDAPPSLVLECRPCSLLELTRERCHWPMGEPDEPGFHFCGGTALAEKPYCHGHCLIAYKPKQPIRRAPFIWRAA
jgi:GcrA cell cycle regulator